MVVEKRVTYRVLTGKLEETSKKSNLKNVHPLPQTPTLMEISLSCSIDECLVCFQGNMLSSWEVPYKQC